MKPDQILQAIPWRCFHCDFITADRAEAEAHFGERDDAEEFKPICRWWDRMGDDEQIQTLQDTLKQLRDEQSENGSLRRQIEGLEYQVDQPPAWKGYRPFRECTSFHDVFCLYDSVEGRALAGEANAQCLAQAMDTARKMLYDEDDIENAKMLLEDFLDSYRQGRLTERKSS